MTIAFQDDPEKPFGDYATVELAHKAMMDLCQSTVAAVWHCKMTEIETGVKAELREPQTLHILELIPEGALSIGQVFIDGMDLVRVDFEDPTTQDRFEPPRWTTLASARMEQ